jgi:hypothetical protein
MRSRRDHALQAVFPDARDATAAHHRRPSCTGDPVIGPRQSLCRFNHTVHAEELKIGVVVRVAKPIATITHHNHYVAGQPEHSLKPARPDGVEVNSRGLVAEADIRPRRKKPGPDLHDLEGLGVDPRQPLDQQDDALVPDPKSADSARFLGFLRKPHDMTLPIPNRLDSEVPEAAVALVGRAQAQAG